MSPFSFYSKPYKWLHLLKLTKKKESRLTLLFTFK
jgi:hypothetical protein